MSTIEKKSVLNSKHWKNSVPGEGLLKIISVTPRRVYKKHHSQTVKTASTISHWADTHGWLSYTIQTYNFRFYKIDSLRKEISATLSPPRKILLVKHLQSILNESRDSSVVRRWPVDQEVEFESHQQQKLFSAMHTLSRFTQPIL